MLDAALQQSVKKETIDELEALVYEYKDIGGSSWDAMVRLE